MYNSFLYIYKKDFVEGCDQNEDNIGPCLTVEDPCPVGFHCSRAGYCCGWAKWLFEEYYCENLKQYCTSQYQEFLKNWKLSFYNVICLVSNTVYKCSSVCCNFWLGLAAQLQLVRNKFSFRLRKDKMELTDTVHTISHEQRDTDETKNVKFW